MDIWNDRLRPHRGDCPQRLGDDVGLSGLVAELVLSFFFLIVILGATDKRAPQGLAPVAIGLALTLIAPIVGAVIAGSVYRPVWEKPSKR